MYFKEYILLAKAAFIYTVKSSNNVKFFYKLKYSFFII